MKHSIIGRLSAADLTTIALPTIASEEVVFNPNVSNNRETVAKKLAPATLVQLAYQGYFKEVGIPGHGGFVRSIISGKLDAETLVASAISKGRVSSDALNDQNYLNIIDAQLRSFRRF